MAKFHVYVTLKPALLDTAGRTVANALRSHGYDTVEDVRIGKVIAVQMANGDASKVEEMCKELLANPVIEDYRIEAAE